MLERLLQDVQGRLIFRFQTFLRDGIRAFLTLTLTLSLSQPNPYPRSDAPQTPSRVPRGVGG